DLYDVVGERARRLVHAGVTGGGDQDHADRAMAGDEHVEAAQDQPQQPAAAPRDRRDLLAGVYRRAVRGITAERERLAGGEHAFAHDVDLVAVAAALDELLHQHRSGPAAQRGQRPAIRDELQIPAVDP